MNTIVITVYFCIFRENKHTLSHWLNNLYVFYLEHNQGQMDAKQITTTNYL